MHERYPDRAHHCRLYFHRSVPAHGRYGHAPWSGCSVPVSYTHLQESTDLPIYEKQLKETEVGITNMLNAIQMGILTSSTKERLEALEEQRKEPVSYTHLDVYKRQTLTKQKLLGECTKWRLFINQNDERRNHFHAIKGIEP